MSRKRKGPVQIRFEILEFLRYQYEPVLKTHVWRKATTLSYDDFMKHVNHLVEKRFVELTSKGELVITDEGKQVYDKLRKVLLEIL